MASNYEATVTIVNFIITNVRYILCTRIENTRSIMAELLETKARNCLVNNARRLSSNSGKQKPASNLQRQQVMFVRCCIIHCLITNNNFKICRILATCRSHEKQKKNFKSFSILFIHVPICDRFLIIISHVASAISFFPKPIHNEKAARKTRDDEKNSVEKNPLCLL